MTTLSSDSNSVVYIRATAGIAGLKKSQHGYEFIRGRYLGKGGFASCYEVTSTKTGKKFAAKIISKNLLTKKHHYIKHYYEIDIHSLLDHSNIVKFYDAFEDNEHIYIILGLCRNLTMSQLIKRRRYLTVVEVRYYMIQLLQAVEYLHKKKIIHRDLKLSNLFITEDMELQVGDFGLSTRLAHNFERKKTICGTPNYLAPEMLLGKLHGREYPFYIGHSFQVDIWSIGVIFYALLFGKCPFEDSSVNRTYSRIRSILYEFPPNHKIPESAKDLIRSILRENPMDRPKIPEILCHSFFTIDSAIPEKLPKYLIKYSPMEYKNQQILKKKEYKEQNENENENEKNLNVVESTIRSRYPLKNRDLNTKQEEILSFAEIVKGEKTNPKDFQLKEMIKEKPCSLKEIMEEEKKFPNVEGKSFEFRSIQNAYTDFIPKTFLSTSVSQSRHITKYNLLDHSCQILERLLEKQEELNKKKSMEPLSNAMNHLNIGEGVCPNQVMQFKLHVCKLWITHWVDYTMKYGMGYLFSDGSCGVYFNDATKIILARNKRNVEYIGRVKSKSNEKEKEKEKEKDGITTEFYECTLTNYGKWMTKKVTLLDHFHSYLMGQKEKEEKKKENLDSATDSSNDLMCHLKEEPWYSKQLDYAETFLAEKKIHLPHVLKLVKTRHAVLFCLSNGSIQVDFHDDSKLLFHFQSPFINLNYPENELDTISILFRTGEYATFSIESFWKHEKLLKQESMMKRIRYAYEMIQQAVKTNFNAIQK